MAICPAMARAVRIAGFFFKTWSYKVPKMMDPALSPGDPKDTPPTVAPADRQVARLVSGGATGQ